MDTTNEDIDNPLQVWKELTEDDLFRGEMPADIVDRCLQLGRTYVGGVWLQAATTEDIVVTRIKGGLTNQLYKIELAAPIAQGHVETDDQPHAVALKLYYPKHDFLHQFSNHDAFERLPDAIILSMASQAALAPRMFGIFPEGFLQRFYDHEQFGIKHQGDQELVNKVATVLARIHNLKVPLAKERNPVIESICMKIEDVYAAHDVDGLCREHKLNLFLEHDIRKEAQLLAKLAEEVDSPMVFSHNDFRGSNILVTQPGKQVYVCDIEYSRYGPRAMDMATILVEWGRELFDFEVRQLPSDSVIEHFIEAYRREMERLQPGYLKSPKNSVEVIKKEVKIFFMLHRIFLLTFLMAKTEPLIAKMKNTKEEDLKLCHPFYKDYFKIKDTLLAEGVISQ